MIGPFIAFFAATICCSVTLACDAEPKRESTSSGAAEQPTRLDAAAHDRRARLCCEYICSGIRQESARGNGRGARGRRVHDVEHGAGGFNTGSFGQLVASP